MNTREGDGEKKKTMHKIRFGTAFLVLIALLIRGVNNHKHKKYLFFKVKSGKNKENICVILFRGFFIQ